MPADHAPRRKIEGNGLILIKPCPRKPRQRSGIDVRLVEIVIPGDQARQHAGIWRVNLARDQCEANARDRFHAEPAQHGDVRVTGANQHDILDDWIAHALHAALTCSADFPCGLPRPW